MLVDLYGWGPIEDKGACFVDGAPVVICLKFSSLWHERGIPSSAVWSQPLCLLLTFCNHHVGEEFDIILRESGNITM